MIVPPRGPALRPAIALALVALIAGTAGAGTSTFFVVRHAERPTGPGGGVDPPLTAEPGMFEFRDRWYLLMGVDLAEYRDHMRRRSAKWETVCLPAEDFRSLARPVESWLNDTHEVSPVEVVRHVRGSLGPVGRNGGG